MPAVVNPRRRPLLGVAGAVAVTALVVSGCSAGQNAQTVEQTSVVDGVAFQAGAINLRDVGLRGPTGPSYAAGANVYLEGLIVNNAATADSLVSITSPVASSVVIYADGVSAAQALLPTPTSAATPSATGSSTDSASPTASASPSDTATSSDSPSPAESSAAGSASASTSGGAAPTPLTELPLPSNQSVQFGYTNQQLSIVFVGLTGALFPAQSVPVTFTFANGGSVTATISVKLPVDSTLEAPTINTEEEEGGGE